MSYDTAETEKSVSVSESMLVTGPGLSQSLMIMSMCETAGCNETKNIVNSEFKSRPRIKFLCSTISVQSRQSKTGTGD